MVIQKFQDIKFEQMKLVFKFKTNPVSRKQGNQLPPPHNVAKKGLYIPQFRTKSYGRQSLKYSAAVLWNNYLKYDRINTFTNLKTFKKHLKNFYLYLYNVD